MRDSKEETQVRFHRFIVSDISSKELVEMSKIIREIFKSAFGMGTWTEEQIQRRLQASSDVYLGYVEGNPVLYCLILLRSYKEPNDYLWISAMAIKKEFQKRGIGTYLLNYLLKTQYQDTKWMGARTQNPSFVRLMQRFCYPVFPLDLSYEDPEGRAILSFSKKAIPECETVNEKGVCKKVYSEGRAGDYPDREELEAIHEMFKRIDCNRSDGDAVIVIGKIVR
jgi:GNAT superfamily N-acetyltransferase